jgi:hypothetical protein
MTMAASPALPVRLNLSALVAFVLGCDGVSAQQPQARLALLIGDQAYNAVVGPLKNPHNDIALIGAALEKLGSRQASFRTRTTAPSTSPSNAIFKACAERGQGRSASPTARRMAPLTPEATVHQSSAQCLALCAPTLKVSVRAIVWTWTIKS